MNKLTSILLVVLALLLFGFTVFGRQSMLRLRQLDKELAILDQKNRSIKSEITELQNQIFAISQDDFELEAQSREQLGLSKPGEIVYIFSEPEARRDAAEKSNPLSSSSP